MGHQPHAVLVLSQDNTLTGRRERLGQFLLFQDDIQVVSAYPQHAAWLQRVRRALLRHPYSTDIETLTAHLAHHFNVAAELVVPPVELSA